MGRSSSNSTAKINSFYPLKLDASNFQDGKYNRKITNLGIPKWGPSIRSSKIQIFQPFKLGIRKI